MKNNNRFNYYLIKLATLGPVGYLPASGTFGSLCAIIFIPIFLRFPYGVRFLFLTILVALGTIVSSMAEKHFKVGDPKEVVIDEFVGQMLVFLPLKGFSWLELGIGFFVFRFFDIYKPWPVSWCDENVKGGLGIILDDIVAGIYAMAVLLIIHFFIFV